MYAIIKAQDTGVSGIQSAKPLCLSKNAGKERKKQKQVPPVQSQSVAFAVRKATTAEVVAK